MMTQRGRGACPFLLFLDVDVDGVTHPLHSTGYSPYQMRPSSFADVLRDPGYFRSENVSEVNRLADALDCDIVISSAWRLDFDWFEFADLFNGRVVEQTPSIDIFVLGRTSLRCREVLRYLAEGRSTNARWLALDDNRHLYPQHAPAYITDGKKGITTADVDLLLFRYQPDSSQP
ncbi:MAG: hypothetical protein HOI95_25760 [Chromatiales bacterium]|nr:hypothetical protein [Chromatiales bacterium]